MNTETPLTAPEIVELIKACGNSGVTEFKLGALSMSFGRPADAHAVTAWPSAQAASPSDAEMSESQQIEKESLEKDELLEKEARLALMLIEDPAGYERLVAQGELEEPASGA